MQPKLKLIREAKLHKILPDCDKKSRLEASGVVVVDETNCAVIFDNRKQIANIKLSLESHADNRLINVLSLSEGFEDLAVDFDADRVFLLIECLEDANGVLCGFVVEYDRTYRFVRASRLDHAFESENKGFEGLVHAYSEGMEFLYGLCEGNLGGDATTGGCLIVAFKRAADGGWERSHEVILPRTAEFEDYSSMAIRNHRLAVVSQASARLWVGDLDFKHRTISEGTVYRFPDDSYCNVEGISWWSDDLIVAVSDRAKKNQKKSCSKKGQSIHLFRLPTA